MFHSFSKRGTGVRCTDIYGPEGHGVSRHDSLTWNSDSPSQFNIDSSILAYIHHNISVIGPGHQHPRQTTIRLPYTSISSEGGRPVTTAASAPPRTIVKQNK